MIALPEQPYIQLTTVIISRNNMIKCVNYRRISSILIKLTDPSLDVNAIIKIWKSAVTVVMPWLMHRKVFLLPPNEAVLINLMTSREIIL